MTESTRAKLTAVAAGGGAAFLWYSLFWGLGADMVSTGLLTGAGLGLINATLVKGWPRVAMVTLSLMVLVAWLMR